MLLSSCFLITFRVLCFAALIICLLYHIFDVYERFLENEFCGFRIQLNNKFITSISYPFIIIYRTHFDCNTIWVNGRFFRVNGHFFLINRVGGGKFPRPSHCTVRTELVYGATFVLSTTNSISSIQAD